MNPLEQYPPVGGEIHKLIPAMMKEIGTIGKEHRNEHFGFSFRGIEDALNFFSPVFVKYGVSPAPIVWDHHVQVVGEITIATLKMLVVLWAEDGSYKVCGTAGEGRDKNGSTATNKAMAAAFKYAMFFGFCIPTSLPDGDVDHELRSATPTSAPSTTSASHSTRQPQKPTNTGGSSGGPSGKLISDKQRKLIWACLKNPPSDYGHGYNLGEDADDFSHYLMRVMVPRLRPYPNVSTDDLTMDEGKALITQIKDNVTGTDELIARWRQETNSYASAVDSTYTDQNTPF